MTRKPFGLYVHLPYCAYKCPYCDFNAYAVAKTPEAEYVAAVIAELTEASQADGFKLRPLRTLYFGGGTPSLFSAQAIGHILSEAHKLFPTSVLEEVSLEANPGSVSEEYFCKLKEAGISRISIGSQSFNETHLKTLGRRHSAHDITQAVAIAREAGLKNISLDLIFAVPQQTLEDLKADLERLKDLNPEHVSIYGLTIEPGTPLFQSVERGILTPVDQDYQADMYELITSTLSAFDYRQYEISNFARADNRSLHNLAYWDGHDYLGVGAGAHSFLCSYDGEKRASAQRWSNLADPAKYMRQALSRQSVRAWSEDLNREKLVKEFFYLGLRKSEGVELKNCEKYFSFEHWEQRKDIFKDLERGGLLEVSEKFVQLTPRGVLVSDSVFETLL